MTIGGVLEIGDTFTLNLPQGLISFVTSNTDVNMTTSSINAAIQAIPAYNIQNYTTSALGNIITVTAKTAGDGFSIGTVTAVNASGVPQIITFTPTNPQTGETFRATINGTDYNHTVTVGQTPTDIVNNLSTLINTRTDVTCSEDDSTITCTTVSGSLTSYNARVLESTADTIAPIIAQINPIASGTDTTPDYTFSSTEEGTIVYLGSCTSNTTQANVGPNTITLNLLEVGTYTDCTVKVRDISNNTSNTLLIPAFTVSAISSGGSGGGGGGGGGGSSNASNSSRFTNTTAKIIEEKDELICRGPSETGTWYKTCVTDLSSATFSDFAANAACEGFITQKDNAAAYELTKSAPRQEVVAVAVKMLKKDGKRVEITTPENYKHHFVDIGVEGQASWIQPIVETALINNIISDARNTFQPENSVTRAEAYAMLMASVCMKPSNTGSTWQQNIYNTAEDVGLTTRTWSTFEPENAIMRQDLFVVASRVADWAEKTGGCNPKPSECVAE